LLAGASAPPAARRPRGVRQLQFAGPADIAKVRAIALGASPVVVAALSADVSHTAFASIVVAHFDASPLCAALTAGANAGASAVGAGFGAPVHCASLAAAANLAAIALDAELSTARGADHVATAAFSADLPAFEIVFSCPNLRGWSPMLGLRASARAWRW
jgi:hypothetical protein